MIRYPGAKTKVVDQIVSRFPDRMMLPLFNEPVEYREPFFGSGAVGLEVLRVIRGESSVWVNDKDHGMACLWSAIKDAPAELSEMIGSFKPSVDAFRRFQEEDEREDIGMVRAGFQKLALHQISFSGLGAMAGGPIGGADQGSEYAVGCRWNAKRLINEIEIYRSRFAKFGNRIRITSEDFGVVLDGAPSHAFVYVDPPYFLKGAQLYKHSMSNDDHERLRNLLRTSAAYWILSYDDHVYIRFLYEEWARIESIELKYTVSIEGEERANTSEVLISPRTEREST